MTSTAYYVPVSDWDKIRLAIETDASALQRLADELAKLHPTRSTEELLQSVPDITGLEKDKAAQLLEFAKRMTFIAWLQSETVSNFLQGVANYLDTVPEVREWWNREKWVERIKFVELLLATNGPIFAMAKAEALQFEHPAVMTQSRIISDARYVFDDEKQNIIGGIVTQTLVIEYLEADFTRKKLFVAMDAADVERIAKQLGQAKQKHEAISATFKSHGEIKDLTTR